MNKKIFWAYWRDFLSFVFAWHVLEFVRHKFTILVKENSHVVKTINWNDSILDFQNLELFIDLSTCTLIRRVWLDHLT
jgi:hypothetical protein